ncbi:nucleotidyltransferase domain-containing protein [Bacillus salacetis]|uniref:nucleotidyltransferase domain-containing protein n=1 Tax=Bacillus salacetis TaxID=2315464 RepID=UPI003BA3CAE1
MTNIKEIGYTARADREGFLLNESCWEKVNEKYRPAIDYIVESLTDSFSDEIHSIYLRGSLPRGLGIEGVSDIDLLVVTNVSPENSVFHERTRQIENEILRRYPFVNGIEVGIYALIDVVDTSRFGIIPFMIKTYSIPLYGKNLQERLPRYKADEKLANEHIVNLKSQIEMALADLEGNEDKEDIKDCCTWIMKIITRCGMALVMTEENTYTRDLYPAYKLFSKHFPEQKEEMEKALLYAINPSEDPVEISSFLKDGLGKWMMEEADKWLKEHNPTELKQLPL